MRVVVAALVALAALGEPGAAAGVSPTHPASFARLRGGNQQPAFGRSGDKGGRKGAFKIAVHATLALVLHCAVAMSNAGLPFRVPCLACPSSGWHGGRRLDTCSVWRSERCYCGCTVAACVYVVCGECLPPDSVCLLARVVSTRLRGHCCCRRS